jgi:uncharacterized protein (TIGR04222 family)
MTGLNPFDWYGGAFLALYAFLFVGAFLGSFALASWLRPEGRAVPVTDEDELALLAGGPGRLAESVVARLLARDEAEIDQQRLVLGGTVTGRSPVERELAGLSSPAKWKEVREWVAASAQRIEELLIARGLLMERGESRQLGLYAAVPLVLLMAFGLTKLEIGLGRDRPVGFLAAFLIVTAIVALFRVFATDRRTKGGVAAVRDARDRSERMRRAPTREETGTAVALWGTAVLVGSPFVDLHKMRRSGDGGDGGGGGDGGSGCGGGGCGGCGGSRRSGSSSAR